MDSIKKDYLLVNIVEELVKKKVKAEMAKHDMCHCDKCYWDVCSIILNTLEPRYVTTEKGFLLTLLAEEELQYKADFTLCMFQAIKQVKASPQH